MSAKEMVFRLISLTLVGVGFIAGVAGADKEGADHTVTAIEELIHDIKKVDEINQINQGQTESLTAVQVQTHAQEVNRLKN